MTEPSYQFLGARTKQRLNDWEIPDEEINSFIRIESAELGRLYAANTRIIHIFDNNHYQYQEGFKNEESWLAIRRRFKEVLQNSAVARNEFVYASFQFRESLALV